MTLIAVWVRQGRLTDELVVAADSRLTGGLIWDGAPKILTFPRGDCVLAFAGNTDVAYPLMIQIHNTLLAYEASATRRLDVPEAARHAVAVINQMRGLISDLPMGQDRPEHPRTLFMFAGFSWRFTKFMAWRIVYSPGLDQFLLRPIHGVRGMAPGRLLKFVGDASSSATSRLAEVLIPKGTLVRGGLDMEPAEILIEFIHRDDQRSIGGTPQIVKIFRHANTDAYAVDWPSKHGRPFFFGRPLLNYERIDVPIIYPSEGFRIERRMTADQVTPHAGNADEGNDSQ